MEFYAASRLPDIEIPLYLTYLENHNRGAHAEALRRDFKRHPKTAREFLFEMDGDGPFMKTLRSGTLFSEDATRNQWGEDRKQFDSLMSHIVWYQYGHKPAFSTPTTLFSSMFLHADIDHLFWNMLFLGIVGYVVEAALGSPLYLVAYLLGGLGAHGFDILMHPDSAITSIGASGAISAVMGMYAVLFGLRRIRFFYWVVFYFDYIRAPAIIMLPLWLGKELYYMINAAHSGINNSAHLGGLVTGALIAAIAGRTKRGVDRSYLDAEDNEQAFKRRYAEGLKQVSNLNLKQAEKIFSELHAERPDDRDLLVQRYNIAKVAPTTELFRQLTRSILSLTDKDPEIIKLQKTAFNEYFQHAKGGLGLTQPQLTSLSLRFATAGFPEEAEMIAKLLPSSASVAPVLLAIGSGYARKQQSDKGREYYQLLIDRHPDSAEANLARQLLASVAAA
jgi:membrane associated rhomboid family serine protease